MRLEDMLRRAMEAGASDLHITVEAPAVIRVEGRVRHLDDITLKPNDTESLADSLLTADQRSRFQACGEVSLSHSVSGLGRFRVMVYRQRGSAALSIRLVYPGIPSLQDLLMPSVIKDLSMKSTGFVLVTGPRGSGKTLAMASIVDHINQNRPAHVITLEDPIEYLHRHRRSIVNQREIGSDTPSFSDGLRAALRQDPDVLAVGDIPDAETFRLCLESAGSGCLVLCSMRSPGIEGAIRSLMGMYSQEQRAVIANQLSECLEGIVSLQLFQTVGAGKPVQLTEVLLSTPGVKDIIREDRLHHIPAAVKTGTRAGMRTFEHSIDDLYATGRISAGEATSLMQRIGSSEVPFETKSKMI